MFQLHHGDTIDPETFMDQFGKVFSRGNSTSFCGTAFRVFDHPLKVKMRDAMLVIALGFDIPAVSKMSLALAVLAMDSSGNLAVEDCRLYLRVTNLIA